MAEVSRTIRLNVTAQVREYVKEISKIPGTTEKQAAAAGRALARELAKAEVQAAKSAQEGAQKSVVAHERAAKAAATAHVDAAKYAAQAAGGRYGELAGRIENASRAFGAMGAVGGPVFLAGAAIAGVSVAAAAAGAAVAYAAKVGSEAIVSLTRAAGETVKEFEAIADTEFGFTAEAVARIEAANAALTAVDMVTAKLGAELAANIAPTVRDLATMVVAFGLAGQDAFVAMAGSADVLGASLNALTRAFFTDMKVVEQAARWQLRMMDAVGLGNNRLKEMVDTLGGFNDAVDDGMIPALEYVGGELMGGYVDRARQFIDVTSRMSEEQSTLAAEVEKTAMAMEKAAAIEAALIQARKQAGKEANAIDKQAIVDAQALTAAKQDQTQAETNYGAILSTTGQVLGAVASMAKKGSKGAAIAAKASGIAQAGINTAVAVTAALTIPPPVGQVLAGINAGIGAAQIAAIAGTPIPAFALGGIVPQSAPRAGMNGLDERVITARPGEVVFTPDQLDAMQGGGAQTTTVNLRLDNRTMSQVIVQAERRSGAVSTAIGRDAIPRYGVSR